METLLSKVHIQESILAIFNLLHTPCDLRPHLSTHTFCIIRLLNTHTANLHKLSYLSLLPRTQLTSILPSSCTLILHSVSLHHHTITQPIYASSLHTQHHTHISLSQTVRVYTKIRSYFHARSKCSPHTSPVQSLHFSQ